MAKIYQLTHKATGSFYIGSTEHLTRRIRQHYSDLKNQRHCNANLQKLYNESVEMKVTVLADICDRDTAYEFEARTILLNKDNPLMCNVLLGGRGGDTFTKSDKKESRLETLLLAARNQSIEERKRRSERMRGDKNHMWGKTHTPEVIERLRRHGLGRPNKNKGVPMPEDKRLKLLEALKDRDYNGVKNPFYGRQHTQETKDVLRSKNKGQLPPNVKRISVNGVIYVSATEAARVLNVPTVTVCWRARSDNPQFSNWFYLDECPETIEHNAQDELNC